MAILAFLVDLFSGAMLLLFSVHFMRIGIERIWSEQIRAMINEQTTISGLVAKGAALGFIMQGSTVVILMAASMAGSGLVNVGAAAVVSLGADLGSALVVRFLTLPVSAIGPFLLLVGAWLVLKGQAGRFYDYGRVSLGLGLVFLSLSIIRAAIEPIASGDLLVSTIDFLQSDWVTAALVGGFLALIMHSSIAALLTIIIFAAQVELLSGTAISLMLGCNIGSALLSIWLLRGESSKARGVALAVASARIAFGTAAVIALLIFDPSPLASYASQDLVIYGHLLFNALVMLSAPLVSRLAEWLAKPEPASSQISSQIPSSHVLADPELGVGEMKKHASQMLDFLSSLVAEVMATEPDEGHVKSLNAQSSERLDDIRGLYASFEDLPKNIDRQMLQIIEFSIRIKHACDVVAHRLNGLRSEGEGGAMSFSNEGEKEIETLRENVMTTLMLAQHAIWTNDPKAARKLFDRKSLVTRLEKESRVAHIHRVRRGNVLSSDSSDQHLATIAILKEINSKLATIGYAIADDLGGLRKSRVKPSFGE